MRFSIWPSFQRPWPELIHLAHHVERQGWHGLWYADHYMVDTPDGAPSDDAALECWSALAALAGSVPRLQLGSLVSPSSVHHPALLANQAGTVDHISGGRLVLGLGAGWQVNEHRAYGFELAAPKERVDRFEEFIAIVWGLLHESRTTFAGRWFTVTDAPCEPKAGGAVPIPILVGSGSPRMLRLTARYADAWNLWGNPTVVRERSRALDAACEREGRDPSTLRRTAQALFFLVDDPATAATIRERVPEDRSVVGGPSEIAEQVQAYADAGVDELIVPDFTLGATAETRRESYDRFWFEVLPGLR
jgi:alkanesulfonate monooxygenase SsuD/methylene tetrahydromethanopterin reductase-like flavin-dependent oxidoreductase (luciferase family)